jgi:RND family efflux transporter MFP subunit
MHTPAPRLARPGLATPLAPQATRARLLAALLAGWPLFCSSGCSFEAPGQAGPGAEGGLRERQAKSVITEAVISTPMEKVLETTCVLESDREVAVLPRAPGLVVSLLAEEGDVVEAGQELARLDDREASLNLADLENALAEASQRLATAGVAIDEAKSRVRTAETNLAQAERDLARDEKLFSGGDARVATVSEKALEASRLTRDRASLELDQAKLAQRRAELDEQALRLAEQRAKTSRDRAKLTLEYTRILAPIDGLVASRTIKIGENVNATQPAFVITDPSLLRAIFFRPQAERALFQSGGPLELTASTESLPGEVFEGRVERVGATIDPTSGSFRVTARLDPRARGADGRPDDAAARLAPGMLLRIRLVTERKPDCLVVKKRAVEREGERAHVVLAVAGRAVRVDVREGLSDLERVEIEPLDPSAEEARHLVAGARVVVVGARDLEVGSELEERAADGAAGRAEPQDEGARLASAEPAGGVSGRADAASAPAGAGVAAPASSNEAGSAAPGAVVGEPSEPEPAGDQASAAGAAAPEAAGTDQTPPPAREAGSDAGGTGPAEAQAGAGPGAAEAADGASSSGAPR